jgi:unsaturated rhamnogalacturonyl hydrolase
MADSTTSSNSIITETLIPVRIPNGASLSRRGAVIALFACMLTTTIFAQQPWSLRMAEATVERWPDGQIVANGKTLDDWAYDKNTLLAGFANVWQNTANADCYRYILHSMDRLVNADGQIPSYKAEELSLDEVALGRELLLLYGRTR